MKQFPKLRPAPWDALVVALVMLLCVGCGLALWNGGEETERLTAVVSVDGEEAERIDLEDVGCISERSYSANGYTLVVNLLPDGERGVRVERSDCPTRDCVHTGTITRAGQSVVCLPARIIIRLEGGGAASDAGPDIVIG